MTDIEIEQEIRDYRFKAPNIIMLKNSNGYIFTLAPYIVDELKSLRDDLNAVKEELKEMKNG